MCIRVNWQELYALKPFMKFYSHTIIITYNIANGITKTIIKMYNLNEKLNQQQNVKRVDKVIHAYTYVQIYKSLIFVRRKFTMICQLSFQNSSKQFC